MGLFDVAGRIIAHFEGDASDLKSEIGKVAAAQKTLTREVDLGAKAQTKSLGDQVLAWGKVAGGIFAAKKAFDVLADAAKTYGEQSRLEAAATGFDIDKIKEAAGGLITEYQALKLATNLSNSDFKASQQEMETAARFMVTLRNEGESLEEAYDGVSKSLTEGSSKALKKFGTIIRAEQGTMEGYKEIVARMAEESEKAGTNISRAGDDAAKAAVKWSEAIRHLEIELGKLADALAPAVEGFASFLGFVTDLGSAHLRGGVGNFIQKQIEDVAGITEANQQREAEWQRAQATIAEGRRSRFISENFPAIQEAKANFQAFGQSLGTNIALPIVNQLRSMGAGILASGGKEQIEFTRQTPGVDTGAFGSAGFGGIPTALPPSLVGDDMTRTVGGFGGGTVPGLTMTSERQVPFDEIVRGSDAAMSALNSLSVAGSAAFSALVTGSESFATAFKKAMAASLLATGARLAGDAISEGVQALISLAGGDLPGAGRHGIAAGKAAAGAIAVGILARALGAGQTPGASAGAGAVGGGAVAGAAGGGGSNVTVFVGSDFERNPRGRASSLMAAFERGRRLEGDETVIFE